MKLYRFLTGSNDTAFCKRVCLALNNGWVLYGGPTLATDPQTGSVICGQAVIKEVDGEYSDDITLSEQ